MTELADTSAWSWSRCRAYPELRGAFDQALIDGELATCDMVCLELLHSARGPTEFAEIREELAALPDCPIDKVQWNRALRSPASRRAGWLLRALCADHLHDAVVDRRVVPLVVGYGAAR